MQDINAEKQWIKSFEAAKSAVEDLGVLFEFHQEGDVSDSEVENKHEEALNLIEDSKICFQKKVIL